MHYDRAKFDIHGFRQNHVSISVMFGWPCSRSARPPPNTDQYILTFFHVIKQNYHNTPIFVTLSPAILVLFLYIEHTLTTAYAYKLNVVTWTHLILAYAAHRSTLLTGSQVFSTTALSFKPGNKCPQECPVNKILVTTGCFTWTVLVLKVWGRHYLTVIYSGKSGFHYIPGFQESWGWGGGGGWEAIKIQYQPLWGCRGGPKLSEE